MPWTAQWNGALCDSGEGTRSTPLTMPPPEQEKASTMATRPSPGSRMCTKLASARTMSLGRPVEPPLVATSQELAKASGRGSWESPGPGSKPSRMQRTPPCRGIFGSFLLGTPTTSLGLARRTISSLSLKVSEWLTLFGVAPSFQQAKQERMNSRPVGREMVTKSFRFTPRKRYARASLLLRKSTSWKVALRTPSPGPASVTHGASPFHSATACRARLMVKMEIRSSHAVRGQARRMAALLCRCLAFGLSRS
mmetsp:Transcript_97481/g.304019  ORF Transcript_97481/g.304019 Transcript_97481/m.304019 type:complete len:252 (+) Transcript_97481:895-1650(+)